MKIFCIVILMFFTNLSYSFGANNIARISGSLPFLKNGDSVELILFKYGYFEYNENFQTTYYSKVVNHSFQFTIPVGNFPLYFNLNFQRRFNSGLAAYLIEKGDNVRIVSNQDSLIYSGKGSAKWNFISQLAKLEKKCLVGVPNQLDISTIKKRFEMIDFSVVAQLNFLNSNKERLTRKAFLLLKGDVLSKSLLKTYFLQKLEDSSLKLYMNVLSKYKIPPMLDSTIEPFFAKSDYRLQYSLSYVPALLSKYHYDSCIALNKSFSTRACYNYFTKRYKGELREKLITYLFLEHKIIYSIRWFEDISSCIDDAIGYIKNKDFKNYLEKLFSIETGAISYNFSLPDVEGKIINMGDFKGKVVLLDFWFTGCANCVFIQPWLKKVEEKFENDSIVFITISTDKDKNTWSRSLKQGKYTTPASINLFTEGKGEAHKIIKHYCIMGFPTLILIDKEGRLQPTPVDPRIDEGKHLTFLIEQALNENTFISKPPVNNSRQAY